jgi:hypothetical protein
MARVFSVGMAVAGLCGCNSGVAIPSGKQEARTECLASLPDFNEADFEDWYSIASLGAERGQTRDEQASSAFVGCTVVYPVEFVSECIACWDGILSAVY